MQPFRMQQAVGKTRRRGIFGIDRTNAMLTRETASELLRKNEMEVRLQVSRVDRHPTAEDGPAGLVPPNFLREIRAIPMKLGHPVDPGGDSRFIERAARLNQAPAEQKPIGKPWKQHFVAVRNLLRQDVIQMGDEIVFAIVRQRVVELRRDRQLVRACRALNRQTALGTASV